MPSTTFTKTFTKNLGLLVTGATVLAFSLDVPVAQAAIIAVGDSGSWAMGANTLSSQGFNLQKVPDNPNQVDLNLVPALQSPLGDLQFAPILNKRRVPTSWTTWRQGYTGEVYWTEGALTLTIALPFATGAFDFYALPELRDFFNISVTAQNDTGLKTLPFTQNVNGDGGAQYFGFYTTLPDERITEITISIEPTNGSGFSTNGFAIGELRLAPPLPIPTPALLPGLVGMGIGLWRKQRGETNQKSD